MLEVERDGRREICPLLQESQPQVRVRVRIRIRFWYLTTAMDAGMDEDAGRISIQ